MSFVSSVKRTAANIAAMGLLVGLSAGGAAADVAALSSWVSGNNNPKVSGSNRLMVVMVMGEHTAAFSANGVTYGGLSMTRQTEKLWGTGYRTYAAIFTLNESGVNAASSGTIAVTWSVTPSAGSSVYSVLLSGVDQTTPVSATANNGLDGTVITTNAIAAASGDMIIINGATSANNAVTFNNSFIKAFESNTSWGDGVGGYKLGNGSSQTPSYSQSASGRMVLCGIAVKKSSSVVNPPRPVYGTVMDIDGNIYQTIVIGNQEWTLENIRTTTFNDGTPIPLVTDDNSWYGRSTPGYCFFNNSTDPAEQKKYGALYNWFAVATGRLAPPPQADEMTFPPEPPVYPTYWRVPSEADWFALENYLIANGYNWDGTTTKNKIAKSMATGIWINGGCEEGVIGTDLSQNNRSGFSALAGGWRTFTGFFNNRNWYGFWWSASMYEYNAGNAYARDLYHCGEFLSQSVESKEAGLSVRLVRNVN